MGFHEKRKLNLYSIFTALLENRMKLFLVAITALLVVSCSKPDKEMILGEWHFSRVADDKSVKISDVPAEQEEIINRTLKEMGQQLAMMNMTEATFRRDFKKDMELMLKTTFKFDAKNVTVASNNPQNPSSNKSAYKLDAEKKQITIVDKTNEIVYKYELTADKLVFKDTKSKYTIEFKR